MKISFDVGTQYYSDGAVVRVQDPPSPEEIDSNLGFIEPQGIQANKTPICENIALKQLLCWILLQSTVLAFSPESRTELIADEMKRHCETVKDIRSLLYEDLSQSDPMEYQRLKSKGAVLTKSQCDFMVHEERERHCQNMKAIPNNIETNDSLSRQSIAHRAVALAYAVCPEILANASMAEIARRCGGISKQTIQKLVCDFEKQFHFRHENAKTESAREAYRRSALKNLVDPTPMLPGFEAVWAAFCEANKMRQ